MTVLTNLTNQMKQQEVIIIIKYYHDLFNIVANKMCLRNACTLA